MPTTHRSAQLLLAAARHGLIEAAGLDRPVERYATVHLAALRAAAAVLATRAQPDDRRGRPTSAWVLLAEIAPELAEWAAFFSAGAAKRAAAEAGLIRVVSTRDADDLLRDVQAFLAVVADRLGLDHQPLLLPSGAPDRQDLSGYDRVRSPDDPERSCYEAALRPARTG